MPYFSDLDIMLKKFITSRVKISEYQCCKNISTLNYLKFSIFCIIHNYKVRKIRKVFPNRYRTEIRNLYLNVLNFKLLYHMSKKNHKLILILYQYIIVKLQKCRTLRGKVTVACGETKHDNQKVLFLSINEYITRYIFSGRL